LEGREGGTGGWRIVIPMPEAINFVDGRRQYYKKIQNGGIGFLKNDICIGIK
jgi:hypothetical protein